MYIHTHTHIYSSRHPKLVLSIHSAGRNSYMIGLFWRKTICTYANILCAIIGTDINPFHEINGNPTHHILVATRRSKLRSIQSQGCYLRKNPVGGQYTLINLDCCGGLVEFPEMAGQTPIISHILNGDIF